MAHQRTWIAGEFTRTLDERFRLSIPASLAEPLTRTSAECVLVKERAGCLSLWAKEDWERLFQDRMRLVEQRLALGDLDRRVSEVQALGRLLSSRHRTVELAGRNRLLVPEGFREFLGVPAGGEVVLVGAAVCVELWHPERWLRYLSRKMARFPKLIADLS
ncbi:MAG: division/cell wall cluster transcriptional repressor MraZ [Thermoguttaceae bacterium]|nr:division/cell wall cluster transcriptional repressor MraZ [Thermoguttaceae bacterium]